MNEVVEIDPRFQLYVPPPPTFLWEVLVPTVRPNTNGKKFFTTRYHRVWDAKVRAISGGLTIMAPAKGQWVSPSGVLFKERMIPVRVMCTGPDIWKVAQVTAEYYEQEAVMFYRVSDEVEIYTTPGRKHLS